MRFDNLSFGSLRIDDSTYEHDVVIDRGEIRDRKKKPSNSTFSRLEKASGTSTV
jgi:hypothetical protein